MIDLMLDETGDIDFDGVDVSVESGASVVAQRLAMRLSIVKGAWIFDKNFGTPYYQNILGGKFSPTILNAVFLDVILTPPGVLKLFAPIEYSFDRRTRHLGMSFSVKTTTGVTLPVTIP